MNKIIDLSDEQVVELVKNKNKEYFSIIVDRYEIKLIRYAKYLINDSDQAQDVVQSSFLKAYVNLNSFNESKKFSSWIYRIVHNEAINLIKKLRKEVKLDFDIEIENNSEEEFDKKEIKNMVNKCISNMPVKYSEILILYYLEDKSYEEISDILRIPMGTVAVRLNRGRGMMKKICRK
jgi:RNA polymerase sigma-70 factor, ECF subfamily